MFGLEFIRFTWDCDSSLEIKGRFLAKQWELVNNLRHSLLKIKKLTSTTGYYEKPKKGNCRTVMVMTLRAQMNVAMRIKDSADRES